MAGLPRARLPRPSCTSRTTAPGIFCGKAPFPPEKLRKPCPEMPEDLSPSPGKKSSSVLSWWLPLLAAAGALLLFLGITGIRIARAASETPAHKADAIVVFGAAEYAGRPSPVYRARLDHGFQLFKKGMAPVVITTGGAGQDPDFSE